MRRALFFLLMAVVLLAACNKSPKTAQTAPSATGAAASVADPVQQKLQQLAGNGATDCGRIKSQEPNQLKPAGDCALAAAQKKQPFYVGYDMPGLSVGVAGNAEGKLFSVMAEQQGQPNAKVEPQAAPCPGELRVAGSGRVTCMTPGSGMGGLGGGPHGGGMPMSMPPGTGENPHGTVGTKPGAANPHAGSGQKIPPKQ